MKEDIYRTIATRYINEINKSRQLISFHKPSIGYVGEELLRNFIRAIIPEGYKVCSGFIRQNKPNLSWQTSTSSNNQEEDDKSKMQQCDIIVYKNAENAVEFECGDIAIVNREFVHMVIEVKTSIGTKGFEKTLKDFELINIERKAIFIYSGPTVQTIKKYFDNYSADDNKYLKPNYLDGVVVNDCVIIDDGVVIKQEDNCEIKYKYDHSNFNDLPELIVSITPEKEYFLSKGYVILDGDYMGYNSLIFEDSKNKRISCLQELACYIDMSFGQNNYTPDRAKINNFYAIPLFPM